MNALIVAGVPRTHCYACRRVSGSGLAVILEVGGVAVYCVAHWAVLKNELIGMGEQVFEVEADPSTVAELVK